MNSAAGHASGSPLRLTIPADLARLAEARAWIAEIALSASLNDTRSFDLQVAVSEATANAIEHAASGVDLTAYLLPDRLIVEIVNDGVFQPGLYKDDEHRRRGLGLPLMVSLADQVHVSRIADDRTKVSLSFFLDGSQAETPRGSAGRISLAIPGSPAPIEKARPLLALWLLAGAFAAAVVILASLRLEHVYNPDALFTVANIVFLTVVSLFVSGLAARSYARGRSASSILVGCGSLALALGALLAALHAGGPGINPIPATYNTAALLAALCYLGAALVGRQPRFTQRSSRVRILLASYLAIAVLVGVLILLIRSGAWPAYFVQGHGTTGIGSIVARSSAFLFAVAALKLALGSRDEEGDLRRWYAIGLGLIAVGLAGVSLQLALGDPLNWVSRASQYVGCVVIFAGLASSRRASGEWELSLDQALRESESRYRNLVDLSPDAIVVDADGKHVFANPAAARLFGAQSSSELLGRDVLDNVQPEDRELVRREMSEVLGGTISPPREVRLLRLDGAPVIGEVISTRVMFEGRLANQAVIRDVTERKQAEEALRASEERFRSVLDSSLDGLYRVNLQTGRYDYMSPAFGPTIGRSNEEFARLSPEAAIRLVHPDDLPRVLAALGQQEMAVTGEVDYRISGSDDKYRWISNHFSQVTDVKGRPLYRHGVVRDISEQQRVKEDLRRSEAHLSFELALSDALRLLDDPSEIQAAAARLLGERLNADRVFYGEIDMENGEEVLVIDRDYHAPGVPELAGRFPFRQYSDTDYEDYRAGRTLWSSDRQTDPRLDKRQQEAYRAADTAAFIGVPLLKSGKLVSVLGVLQRRSREWTTEDVRLAEATSDRTWHAVQSARSEKALRESEERFRLALENAPVSVAAQDLDLRYVWAYNQRTARPNDIVGKTDADLFPQEAHYLTTFKRKILESGNEAHEQFWVTRPGGRLFLDVHCVPRRGEDGKVIGLWMTSVDLTSTKQAEEELRRSEATLGAILDATTESIWLFSPGGTILAANAIALNRIGRPSEEIIGKHFNEVLTGELAAARLERLRQVVESGQPLEFEDARAGRAFQHTFYPELDDQGHVARVASFSRDITARKQLEAERERLLLEEQEMAQELAATNEELLAQTEELAAVNHELESQAEELAAREEELRAQNEELLASRYNRSLIEASLDPLVTISLDGKISDLNEATIKVTGCTRAELLGTDFSDYFTDPLSARMGYREAFAKGAVTDYPLTIRARDGRLTDVLYNASVYRDEEGDVLGVFAAARDVSMLKELEEQRDIASKLQETLLDIPEQVPGVELAHLYRSATQKAVVGGDFYDVFRVKDGKVAVLVGDVSGHGVEAARLATLVRDVIHAFAHQCAEPALILKNTNNLLIERETPGFVTVFLGILDPATGLLIYTSAGHPNALLRSPSGEVELLEAASAPVGVFSDRSWKQNEVRLEGQDILFLYTDGAMEARRNNDFFGQRGLIQALGEWSDPSLEFLPQTLLEQVLSFSGGELTDDVAMLALALEDDGKRTGGRPPM